MNNNGTKYLLFVYKSFFPGGGINDLNSTWDESEKAFAHLIKLTEHPYSIHLVERDNLVLVKLFFDCYQDYLSIINNSKFEPNYNKFVTAKEDIDKLSDRLRELDEMDEMDKLYIRDGHIRRKDD